jgi:Rieske Fe-S protein
MAEQQAVPAAGRRTVLAAAGGVCAAALAGCSAYNANNGGVAGPPPSAALTGSTGAPASGTSASGAAGAGSSANVLASTSQVPVGGGTVLTGKRIVITQPTAGAFHAFTAVCTHQGCIVDAVSDGTIDCPCHGSKFSATDGSVVHGPAPTPLAAIAISVQGTSIVQSPAA